MAEIDWLGVAKEYQTNAGVKMADFQDEAKALSLALLSQSASLISIAESLKILVTPIIIETSEPPSFATDRLDPKNQRTA